MLEFCLLVDLEPDLPQPALAPLCPIPPEKAVSFRSGPISVQVFWAAAHPFASPEDRVLSDRSGLRLLAGFPLSPEGRAIRTPAAFAPADVRQMGGDFLSLSVDPEGRVTILKSPVCSYQLYHARSGRRHVLASRAGFAAMAMGATRPEPDPEFARWACTYAIGGTTASVLRGVQTVLMNQSVVATAKGIAVTAPDFRYLSDPAMADLYRTRPRAFWDETHDRLVASTRALEFSDDPIDFPLSGGKDSRLLLAALIGTGHRGRIATVFTNGPAISPEVRSARLVCDALGLAHHRADVGPSDAMRRIDARLPMHTHLTEAEISPDTLSFGTGRQRRTELHGQEGGLRNIAHRADLTTREAVIRWFEIHLGEGDRCRMFRPGLAEQTRDEIRAYVDKALAAQILPEDIPTLHRVTFRMGRWVARTWRIYNDRWFAPYLFVDAGLIRATFNSGAMSRLREEFHFEMLRRFDRRLVSVPFAGQSWDRVLAPDDDLPTPLEWPSALDERRARPMHEAMVQQFPRVQEFFRGHSGPVTDVLLDRDRFAGLDIATMHPATYQSLWQLVQIALLERVPDLAALAGGHPATDYGLPSFAD